MQRSETAGLLVWRRAKHTLFVAALKQNKAMYSAATLAWSYPRLARKELAAGRLPPFVGTFLYMDDEPAPFALHMAVELAAR